MSSAPAPITAVRRLSSRTPLRTKLVASVLLLVLAALVAMSVAGVSLLRGQLLAPYDNSLQFYTKTNDGQGRITECVQEYLNTNGNGPCSKTLPAISWIPPGGAPQTVNVQQEYPSVPAAPSLAGAASWLASNPYSPTTVSASDHRRWRVESFQYPFTVIHSDGTPTTTLTGTIVVGLDASSAYTTIRQLIGVDVIVSAAILLVVGVAGFGLVRSNLRPLVDIEETAGEIAEGHLNRRVPERDPRTEVGSLGKSLNTMLTQIETAFHDREESEAAAHQSEERMRRFIADASHELRTPLTTIRGFAEYYRQRGGLASDPDEGLTAEDLERIMQRVEAEAARMGVLVEDLLLLARMDQQRPLALNPVDMLTIAADAVHDTRMLAPGRDISLSVQPGSAFLVNGDEPRLRQVIGNLMNNALTHTPEGTPIEVTIGMGTLRGEPGPPAVVLTITDHGPGMTKEQAERVFERFYRADAARTRAKGGSGLGLAIVAALTDAHDGAVSVHTSPGHGATFRVALPLAPEAQAADSDADDDDGDAPGAPGTPGASGPVG